MGARILFVTGKGGTGKSTVAAGLAHEAVRRGQPALLIRMPPSSAAGAAAGEAPSPSGRGRGAAQFREQILDPERDLEAFLTRVLGFGFFARRLRDSRTFSAVAAAAPGLRDLVALSAIATEAARHRGLIVVDAPASGHSVPMLTAPSRVLELTTLGPVAREARRAHALVAAPATFSAVLVTTPEELSITEVVSLRGQVLAAGVAAAHIVINAVWPAYLARPEGEQLVTSGASADVARHWRRQQRQAELIAQLDHRAGACSRIGFSFANAQLPKDDVEALYDSLVRTAA